MSKVAVSAVLAILLGGAVIAGLNLFPSAAKKDSGAEGEASAQLAEIKKNLQGTQAEVKALKDRLGQLEASQSAHVAAANAQPVSPTEGKGQEGGDPERQQQLFSPKLREYVFAWIEEDRKRREEEDRQRQEERRQRFEERRKEIEELSKGPYDRYNLKVNSMAKTLGLSEAQRDSYYELTKKYSEKFDEARRSLQGERGQGEGAGKRGGGRERSQEGRERFQQLAEGIQKEFGSELETVLTAPQLEAHNNLPERAQSFLNLGLASESEEERGGPMGGFFGEMGRGRPGGVRAGSGVRAGPGGRGGR